MMKKCLISGVAAFVLGGFLASCSHDDEWTSVVDSKLKAYEEVFHEEFGTIDPNQTWGFTRSSSFANTTRTHNKNSNEWASQGWNIPDPLTDAQKDKVRRWFQQHKNPRGIAVDYSNFFVQQVYEGHTNLDEANSDCKEIYLSGANAANGVDPSVVGGDHMDKLTAGSKEDHINDFNNADRGEINVQNNNKIGEHYDAITLMVESQTDCFGYYNSEESGQYNNKYVIIPGDSIQQWDSTGGANADVSGMFFVGFDFEYTRAAYSTWTDDQGVTHRELNANTNQYLVTPTTDDDPNGVVLPNDHTGGKKFLIGGSDGYYSDWIVRITEGIKTNFTPETVEIPVVDNTTTTDSIRTETIVEEFESTQLVEQGRVFCEDLGQISSNDLDFNDVVFDAYIYEKKNYTRTTIKVNGVITQESTDTTSVTRNARIVLLAAGGTLPLSVASHEVHDEFGHYSTSTIINTIVNEDGSYGNDFETCDPVELTGTFNYSSIIDIPISIFYSNGEVLTLDAKSGMAPHKILVPVGTKWTKERVKVDQAYTDFKKYVGESYNFWDGDKWADGLYNHPKDNYEELSTAISIRSIQVRTTTTTSAGETHTSGGYQGEPVLSRELR